MASLLPGFKKLPGKSERYVTPSGEEISRRQYENLRFKKAGWRSWSEYQREAKTPEYRRWLSKTAETRNMDPRKLKAPGSEFNRRFVKAKRSGFTMGRKGKFADFLTYTGYRGADWTFDIGDTPMAHAG